MLSPEASVASTRCVVVFTNRGKDRLWAEGGSNAWRMDASRAAKCEYVVCVQNRNGSWGGPSAPHKTAFMIGKIEKIVPSEEDAARQKIVFSKSAEISVPDMWDGNRNPVAYMTLGDFGINTQRDLQRLKFTTYISSSMLDTHAAGDDYQAAEASAESEESGSILQGISIDEAKRGLARRFEVSEAQIEILIRA
ncbi:hypothetical protein EXN22_17920 [Pseudomonas tructae]|uniref:Uncharacterized protein n=1 Tax=Pseudomonas tructae TaxID=2518644 RepID=A0A411MKY9_9PSED|nr:hypothetical protein [Pseudomonas tructae]QBF27469.1 hypothetical protein EXN22_17920 [Pseudomonas tructae]